MGVYDIYEGIQLKVGDVTMCTYRIGDKVNIEDGIYVGYEGMVVVKDGIFIAKYRYLTDKWGNKALGHDYLVGILGE